MAATSFHFPLFSALLFISPYVLTISSSSNILFLGLPLLLFPSILPSSTSFNIPSPLTICPIQFLFLHRIKFTNLHTSPLPRTSSFLILSDHSMLSIFLHIHTSIASSLLIPFFFSVQVSHPYSSVVHTKVFTIFFLQPNDTRFHAVIKLFLFTL
jgi:hypothetical protein